METNNGQLAAEGWAQEAIDDENERYFKFIQHLIDVSTNELRDNTQQG